MRKLKIIFVNIVIFIFLLFSGEIGIRIFFPNYHLYKRTLSGQFNNRFFTESNYAVIWPRENKNLGWVCNNSSKITFSNPYYKKQNIKYSINNDGFRKTFGNYIKNNGSVTILGDSFVFGVYLNDSSTIPYYFQQLSGYKSVNLGIPGWGIDQMYLSYWLYAEKTNSKLIILFFIDDDIRRVVEAYRFTEGMNKPSFEIFNDSLVIKKNSGISFIEKMFQNIRILNPFYKWYWRKYAIKLTKIIFKQLRNKTIGKNFYIVHIPVKEQVLFPKKYPPFIEHEFYKMNNLNYIDLTKQLTKLDTNLVSQFYLINDGHLSSIGTRKVAQIVLKEIKISNENY